jgi:hypothetical protein
MRRRFALTVATVPPQTARQLENQFCFLRAAAIFRGGFFFVDLRELLGAELATTPNEDLRAYPKNSWFPGSRVREFV